MYVSVSVAMYTCIWLCMYVCVCVCVYVHMYTCIWSYSRLRAIFPSLSSQHDIQVWNSTLEAGRNAWQILMPYATVKIVVSPV
jgi:hypothetical protein